MKEEKMLALVYHGPQELRLEERPLPHMSESDLLLKVKSTGICGTDLRIYHGVHRMYAQGQTRIPGHEVVGEIVAIGSRVSGFDIGEQVFVAPNMGCGNCKQCKSGNNNRCADYEAIGITCDGSFAEYMLVPGKAVEQGNLIPIRQDMDAAIAALIEPFACVLRGQKVLQIRPGESVLVVGAGPIGMMHVMLAKSSGAGRVMVSELSPDRLAQAKLLGADRVINPEQEDLAAIVAEETSNEGVDVVIVAAPASKAQEDALEIAALGGRINFFGGLPKDRSKIRFDSNLVHYKELVVTGTTACSTDDCRQAAALVDAGKVDLSRLIGTRFPLTKALEAFEKAATGDDLKVILEP